MNRRNFIKGLAGIAGMAAAGQAAGIVRVESLMVLPKPKKIIKPKLELVDVQSALDEISNISGKYRGSRHSIFELPMNANDGDWVIVHEFRDDDPPDNGVYLRQSGAWVYKEPLS